MGKNVNLLFSGSARLPADFNNFLIRFAQAVIVIFIHFSPAAALPFTAEPCAFRFPFSSSFLLYLFYYFTIFLLKHLPVFGIIQNFFNEIFFLFFHTFFTNHPVSFYVIYLIFCRF